MKLIYVAHKYRDKRGPYWTKMHIQEAADVAVNLWRMGAAVICPGLNTFFFDGSIRDGCSEPEWFLGDLEMVRRCDAVVLSPNWITSQGAEREKQEALSHGIPVFEWAHGREPIQEFIDRVVADPSYPEIPDN